MPDPIIEQVAEAIVDTLETITVANGYNYDVSGVVRPTRLGITPAHLLLVVEQVGRIRFPEQDYAGNPPAVAWHYTYDIHAYVVPSDDDTDPVEKKIQRLKADIEAALMDEATKPEGIIRVLTIGTSELGEAENFAADSGAFSGITIKFIAHVRVSETDPYQQR